ncbi:MAG: IclR family transcriptional regulator [Ramlibacter sp.]|nr:IclR family transcriptional regulator [Ramlibacter sp.]
MPRKAQTGSLADTHAAPGGTAAVDRALTLLAAFRAGDTVLTLAELAERTQLYKSTALRLLASLAHAGLVQRQDNGTDRAGWVLGPEVARLHGLYAASFSLDRVVMPVLQALMRATGESAAYHVLRGEGPEQVRLCLYRVDSPQPIRDFIKAGDVLSATRGTGARVLQAFATTRAGLATSDRRLLAGIRERGFFAANGDRLAGVTGISAPVFHADGRIAAAVTLTMPTHRYDDRHVPPVLAAARQLSGQVGAP